MYCSQCGTHVPDDSAFCHQCAARVYRAETKEEGASAPGSPPAAQAASAGTRRGYCERCGQELGVNEKMRGLTVHQKCPTQAPEAPPEGLPVERQKDETGVPVAPPSTQAAPPHTRRGYCERCGEELGVNEKMRGLTVHQKCPTPAPEAPPEGLAAEGEGPTSSAATPVPQAASAGARRGYCERCGQELGINEKMRGLTAHQKCPTLAPEAPPEPVAAEGEGPASSIRTPKWVKDQLSQGEEVLSKISGGVVDYYATDKRLLRLRGKSDRDVLQYDKLSIALEKYGGVWHILTGILILCGLLLIALAFFSVVEFEFRIGTTVYHQRGDDPLFALFAFFVGLFSIPLALHFRYAYYQIDSPALDRNDLKKWRIERNRWGAGNIDRFARIVQERSGSYVA